MRRATGGGPSGRRGMLHYQGPNLGVSLPQLSRSSPLRFGVVAMSESFLLLLASMARSQRSAMEAACLAEVEAPCRAVLAESVLKHTLPKQLWGGGKTNFLLLRAHKYEETCITLVSTARKSRLRMAPSRG